MNSKYKRFITMITLAFCFILGGCQCIKEDKGTSIQKIIEISAANFKNANISMILKSGELVVHSKEISVIKNNEGSIYSVDVERLSEDLYAESMYEQEHYSGTFTKEETNALLPNSLQFNENKLNDYKKENDKITCVINKDNIMSLFGLSIQDINKISNQGVRVEFLIENDKIIKYIYSYDTNDNLKVTITGIFVY